MMGKRESKKEIGKISSKCLVNGEHSKALLAEKGFQLQF